MKKTAKIWILGILILFTRCGQTEQDAIPDKTTLKTENIVNKVKIELTDIPKQLSLFIGEEKEIAIPQATETFDADKNDTNLIPLKIKNNNSDFINYKIEENKLILSPQNVGNGTLSLEFASSEGKVTETNIIKQYIQETIIGTISYNVNRRINSITVPPTFPTLLFVRQNVTKIFTLPSVTDSFGTEIVGTATDDEITITGNSLSISSATIGTKTITITYKSLAINEKATETKSQHITLTTQAPIPNTITIPTTFPTALTVIQNVEKTFTLPSVTDSFGTEIIGTETDNEATLTDSTLSITSTTIGTKTITITFNSLTINGKIASRKTFDITILTQGFTPNVITISSIFPTYLTVIQNIAKTFTLPTASDSFGTKIVGTETDDEITLTGNTLSITSATVGSKILTITYNSLALNEKTATTKFFNISITTQSPNVNAITVPSTFPTTLSVTQNVAKTFTLPSVTDSFGTEIIGTKTDDEITLTNNTLSITSTTVGTKTISITYTSIAKNEKIADTRTLDITLTTQPPPENTITVPSTFPTTLTATQNVAKSFTLPAVTDTFGTEIVGSVTDSETTLTNNTLSITSATLGTKTITITYNSIAKNGKTAATKTLDISLTTQAPASINTITMPSTFPTTFTIIQNEEKSFTLPSVTDTFGNKIRGKVTGTLANAIIITTYWFIVRSTVIGIKTVTVTFNSLPNNGKTADTKTIDITITTQISDKNIIVIPSEFPSHNTITQYVKETITLPVVTDSFGTELLGTVTDRETTLTGKTFSITSARVGEKSVTITYISQTKNGKAGKTRTINTYFTTQKNVNTNTINFPNQFPSFITITQNVTETITLPIVTDSFGTELLGTITDSESTLTGKTLSVTTKMVSNKFMTITYTSQTKNGKFGETITKDFYFTVKAIVKNTFNIPSNFPTSLTLVQGITQVFTLPAVLDSGTIDVIGVVTAVDTTLSGNMLTITSATVGTKILTITYYSEKRGDKIAISKTVNITIITQVSAPNEITVPSTFPTTLTVMQNVSQVFTLPAVTDSFGTKIEGTITDSEITLTDKTLAITAGTIGSKTITITYNSLAINGKTAVTKTLNITLVTEKRLTYATTYEEVIKKKSIDLHTFQGTLYDKNQNIIKEEGEELLYSTLVPSFKNRVTSAANLILSAYGQGIVVHASGFSKTLKVLYAISDKIYLSDDEYIALSLDREECFIWDLDNNKVLELPPSNPSYRLSRINQENNINKYGGYNFINDSDGNSYAISTTLPLSKHNEVLHFKLRIKINAVLHRNDGTTINLKNPALEGLFNVRVLHIEKWASFPNYHAAVFESTTPPLYSNE